MIYTLPDNSQHFWGWGEPAKLNQVGQVRFLFALSSAVTVSIHSASGKFADSSSTMSGSSSDGLAGMVELNMSILTISAVVLTIYFASSSHGYTYEQDVYAINNLYTALGSPPLPGWVPSGGDPCVESWQGVSCVFSNITSIVLNGANLGGQLGSMLENFSSIITIDLSNNHIGGNIPSNLPITLQGIFLSANQFVGVIPSSLSTLTLLTALSLNNNLLSGDLPDSFQTLSSLANLDLSYNNLSGHLPSSLGFLSSLITLHLQNNSFSGTLDILQDIPLQDLNIENNLFSGPVPEKILSIPILKKDGNPFNTTIAPSKSPPSPPTVLGMSPSEVAIAPSVQDSSQNAKSKKFWTSGKIVGSIAVAALLCLIFILLLVCCLKYLGRPKLKNATKPQVTISLKIPEPKIFGTSTSLSSNETSNPKAQALGESCEQIIKVMHEPKKAKDNLGVDVGVRVALTPQPVATVIDDQIIASRSPKTNNLPQSVKVFSVASLQEYTNCFKQENLIGRGILGNVYRAELPDGMVLAVKKLDVCSPYIESDEAFLDLVSSVSKLRHKNVVNLEGYCWEHGQRLLAYEYCSNGTLYEALHSDSDEFNRKLSWDARLRIALGVARALEYLHEAFEPPVIHRNFKSSNILLDEKHSALVSDCGVGSLISAEVVSQFSDHLQMLSYHDPISVQTDTYTSHSDVYSFGVVMLELFTGRKPYDSSRPRGEQLLVEWAKHQLHDFASLQKMADPSINTTFTLKSMSKFADIISLCVQTDPSFRLPMSDIVQRLLDVFPSRRPEIGLMTHINDAEK